MKKKIIVSVFVSIVVIAAIIVTAVVLSRKEPSSADDVRHDKTVTTPEGETLPLDYAGTEDMLNGDVVDKYTDQDGNTYSYNKDGKNTSYALNLDAYREKYYKYIDGEFDSIEEEKAVEIASAELESRYGEYFDDMSLIHVYQSEDDGSWHVYFAELLGEGDFIEGISCNAQVLADGTVAHSAIGGIPDFEGIGDEQVEGITFDRIAGDFEEELNEKYGDKFISFDIDKIKLRNEHGRVVVVAFAWSRFWLNETQTDYGEEMITYELND